MKTILIIDDEVSLTQTLTEYLSGEHVEVYSAATGQAGLEICSRKRIDVVLLDQRLPDIRGESLCKPLLELNPKLKIIFSTAYPSFENVVTALRLGAYDYLSKPMELEELDLAIERAFNLTRLEEIEEVSRFHEDRERREAVIVGEDEIFTEVRRLADLAADSMAPVLITGETGTGKNIIAKYIHYQKFSYEHPFVSVNAAAIPRELIESELFGHEKGAFTGANQTRKGMFELADGGTLFLDEIGNLIPELQAKLLSVLEERRVRRVGAERSMDVNVRIIAATNANLQKEITHGRFRGDLYYRLNVVHIHLPPLRERKGDIMLLSQHFVSQLAGVRKVEIPEAEMEELTSYAWPGNVRELRNIIERTLTLQKGRVIYPSSFLQQTKTSLAPSSSASKPSTERQDSIIDIPGSLTMSEVEKRHILRVLGRFEGNLAKTARVLAISESTLRRRMKSF